MEQGRGIYLLSSCFSNDLVGMVRICLRSLRLEHKIGNHSNHHPIMFKHALVNLCWPTASFLSGLALSSCCVHVRRTWSFCSLRYSISCSHVWSGYTREGGEWRRERDGGGERWCRPWLAHRSNEGGPEKTLVSVCCPGRQHTTSAGRGGGTCWYTPTH